MSDNAIVDAALRYAARGWLVLPLHSVRGGRCSCGGLACKNGGKHPRTLHGLKDSSGDPAIIARWWSAGDSNIAIVTGPASRLLVLDVDVQHDGEANLAKLERENAPLPETVEVLTGGGGRHLYFRYPETPIPNSASRLGCGLDIRGEGGYVVAPPSVHISGRRYVWEAAHHPDDMAVADPPDWLVDLLTSPVPTAQMGSGYAAWRRLLEPIPQGTRNATLTSVAGWLRLYHPKPVVMAILEAVNLARCQPSLEKEESAGIVHSVFRYSQPGTNGHPKAAVPHYVRKERNDA